MAKVCLQEDTFGCFTDQRTNESSPVRRFTWSNANNITVQVISYGATITTLTMPDKYGKVNDIVLGYNDMAGYTNPLNAYLGAAIGRVGNRIRDSKITIEGQNYELSKNFLDNHQIHGGIIGFDKVNWKCYVDGSKVVMSCTSEDGEEGFPGQLLVNLAMELTNDDEFLLDFNAMTTKPTVINLTHHSYFNLAGHTSGEVGLFNHRITINADYVKEVDEHFFPTGKLLHVAGTPFDLRTPKVLTDVIDAVPHAAVYFPGYDHNFCVNRKIGENNVFVAKVIHPCSGRAIEFYSNQPGVQFYTSNTLKTQCGKDGSFGLHCAFCMEPQKYPDSAHFENFPSTMLYPGEIYKNSIVYKFCCQ